MSRHIPSRLARECANELETFASIVACRKILRKQPSISIMSFRSHAVAKRRSIIWPWLACLVLCVKEHVIGDVISKRELVSLFNPRIDNWLEHFSLTKRFRLSGRTARGRATIDALAMNRESMIAIRQVLAELQRYPPADF